MPIEPSAGNGLTSASLHALDQAGHGAVEQLLQDRASYAGVRAEGMGPVDPETAARRFLDQALASPAVPSLAAPVANGATMVSGRFGQSCALACCAKTIAATAAKALSIFNPRPLISGLLCLDPGGVNDLRPFRHFGLEELVALLRRATDRLVAERAQALLDIWQRDDGCNHPIQ